MCIELKEHVTLNFMRTHSMVNSLHTHTSYTHHTHTYDPMIVVCFAQELIGDQH